MGTVIRSEVSKKNPYYISRHRYYELKHFCLQYYEWKHEYDKLAFYSSPSLSEVKSSVQSDRTGDIATKRAEYARKMDLVHSVAMNSDPAIGEIIFKAVTEGKSYESLNAKERIICGKNYFYDKHRKFFWLMDSIV